jgi:hypothetical protein
MSTQPPITYEQFVEAVGELPINDDLQRCNCVLAGQPGHYSCGWNRKANLPVFMAGPEES